MGIRTGPFLRKCPSPNCEKNGSCYNVFIPNKKFWLEIPFNPPKEKDEMMKVILTIKSFDNRKGEELEKIYKQTNGEENAWKEIVEQKKQFMKENICPGCCYTYDSENKEAYLITNKFITKKFDFEDEDFKLCDVHLPVRLINGVVFEMAIFNYVCQRNFEAINAALLKVLRKLIEKTPVNEKETKLNDIKVGFNKDFKPKESENPSIVKSNLEIPRFGGNEAKRILKYGALFVETFFENLVISDNTATTFDQSFMYILKSIFTKLHNHFAGKTVVDLPHREYR
eukprot:TRINITY_DN674_c0_g2_i2.p1 TRINITY_DN674_c0_g2~~TRINITY_DN674_c0_g2_i2.p1  ORF type:complete len:284 (-),score=57.14 TRINITY_DN674_c0_g2_i2:113-964(-)